jgi:hypothetical protein
MVVLSVALDNLGCNLVVQEVVFHYVVDPHLVAEPHLEVVVHHVVELHLVVLINVSLHLLFNKFHVQYPCQCHNLSLNLFPFLCQCHNLVLFQFAYVNVYLYRKLSFFIAKNFKTLLIDFFLFFIFIDNPYQFLYQFQFNRFK